MISASGLPDNTNLDTVIDRSQQREDPLLTAAAETSFSVFARRLGLSFWGHHADGDDFIVMHLASPDEGVSQ